MTVQRFETTFFPNESLGRKYADEYEKKLKEQRIFWSKKEDTVGITLIAYYTFEIADKEVSE